MQFDTAENAETAICTLSFGVLNAFCADKVFEAKFTGYQYGGRPLGLTFVKYMSANGGDAMEGEEPTGGITQDQIM